MNRKELITVLSEKEQISKKDAEARLESVLEVIKDALVDLEDVRLSGFGTFSVKNRAERTGRNPQTKEEIIIPAKKAPAFKPGKELKELVNGGLK